MRNPGVIRLGLLTAVCVAGVGMMLCLHCIASEDGVHTQETAAEREAYSLDSLHWLVGRWQGEYGTRRFEEHWSAAHAGNMTGMFRMIEGDRVVVIEIITIEQHEQGVVKHLRHFGTDLKPWEETPLIFDLVDVTTSRAVFRNRGDEGPTWAVYTLKADDSLDIWVGATRERSEQGFTLPMMKK